MRLNEQVLGISVLMCLSAVFFTRFLDILFCTACVYALIFVCAELGVWAGVLYRKENDDEP